MLKQLFYLINKSIANFKKNIPFFYHIKKKHFKWKDYFEYIDKLKKNEINKEDINYIVIDTFSLQ